MLFHCPPKSSSLLSGNIRFFRIAGSVSKPMFYFLCKRSFLRGIERQTTAASQSHRLFLMFPTEQSAFRLSNTLKCMSISTSSDQEESLTISYLINKLGLPPESAMAASKYLHLNTPDNADSVVTFLGENGFSESQIKTLVKKYPCLLASNVEKTLVPKLEFLHSKGFSCPDLAKFLCYNPYVLARSLVKHIVPFFNSFSKLTHSDEITVKAIKRYPYILTCDIDAYYLANINLLRHYGVPESSIVMALQRFPSIFTITPGVFKGIVEEVKAMGFDPLTMKFINAVSFLRNNNKRQRKFDVFKKWGWPDQVILNAFHKDPSLISATEEKIAAIMDFLVNRMGLQSLLVAKHPSVLGRSLEKRIVPRGLFAQDLLSTGLIKDFSLSSLFDSSEKVFLQRFVYKFGDDKAPVLLKIYKDKVECAAVVDK